MTDYPNREHRSADSAARQRAIGALAAMAGRAHDLIGKLQAGDISHEMPLTAFDARIFHDMAGKVSENLTTLETLREVREWDAAGKAQAAAEKLLDPGQGAVQDIVRDRQSARAAEEPKLCMRCGIASTVDAPLQYSGVPGGWLCIDTRNCNKRREVNGGRVVPQAVADARETKAWRDGYESTARLIGSAGCTSRCDHANGIHAPARYDGLCHELAFSGDCSLARDHSGKHDWER